MLIPCAKVGSCTKIVVVGKTIRDQRDSLALILLLSSVLLVVLLKCKSSSAVLYEGSENIHKIMTNVSSSKDS